MNNDSITLNEFIEERNEQGDEEYEKKKTINGLCSGLYLLCSNALIDAGFSMRTSEIFLMNEFKEFVSKDFEARLSEKACHKAARQIEDMYVLRKTYDEVVAQNDEYGKALARGESTMPVDLGNGQKARLNLKALTYEDELAIASNED